MNKKELTEADIRTKFITPALVSPGGTWDLMTQLREEVYFTKVSSSRTDIRGLGREGIGLLSGGQPDGSQRAGKGGIAGVTEKTKQDSRDISLSSPTARQGRALDQRIRAG